MTKINAQIIADSKNEFGNRITTMVVTFPRYILAELNTHRMLSKNSASSRAIPFEKLMQSVLTNPFIPIAWMKDHKGMQGTEYFEDADTIAELERQWLQCRSDAINRAVDLSHKGLTKQLINRILEPFMWHTVIITATEWENFFALRCPKYHSDISGKKFRSRKEVIKEIAICETWSDLDWLQANRGQADIHMMTLAEAMYDAYQESTPKELKAGEWHIPFGDNIDMVKLIELIHTDDLNEGANDEERASKRNPLLNLAKVKIATARCARISYTVVGDKTKEADYAKDLMLHDNLASSGHWSPFEHCAVPMTHNNMSEEQARNNIPFSGNFRGFIQYRKTFINENIQ